MKFYKKWCTKIYPKIQHIQKYTKYTKIVSDTDTDTHTTTDRQLPKPQIKATDTDTQTDTYHRHTHHNISDRHINPTHKRRIKTFSPKSIMLTIT